VCARDAPGRWSWASARRSLGESLVQSGRRCAPASVIAPPDRPAWRSPVSSKGAVARSPHSRLHSTLSDRERVRMRCPARSPQNFGAREQSFRATTPASFPASGSP
jgi:hypothetical protein